MAQTRQNMEVDSRILTMIVLGLGLAYVLHQHWNLKEEFGKMEQFLLSASGYAMPQQSMQAPAASAAAAVPMWQQQVPQSARRIAAAQQLPPAQAGGGGGGQQGGGGSGKAGPVNASVFSSGDDTEDLVDLSLGAAAKRR